MISINVEVRGPIVNSTPTNTALNDSDSRAPPESCGELEPGVNERKQLAPPNPLLAKPVSPASASRPLPSRSSRDKCSLAFDMTSATAVSGGASSARLIRHQNELQHETSQGVSAHLKDGDGHEFESFYKDGEPDDHTLSQMHIGGVVSAPIASALLFESLPHELCSIFTSSLLCLAGRLVGAADVRHERAEAQREVVVRPENGGLHVRASSSHALQ